MVRDVAPNGRVIRRTAIIQQKTGQPVSFELTEPTRDTVQSWIDQAALGPGECLFPSRLHASEHLSTRQYARIVKDWVASIGLDPAEYGTHSLRRTKATLNLPQSKEPSGGTDPPRSHQAREHRALSGSGDRRCVGNIREDRNMILEFGRWLSINRRPAVLGRRISRR